MTNDEDNNTSDSKTDNPAAKQGDKPAGGEGSDEDKKNTPLDIGNTDQQSVLNQFNQDKSKKKKAKVKNPIPPGANPDPRLPVKSQNIKLIKLEDWNKIVSTIYQDYTTHKLTPAKAPQKNPNIITFSDLDIEIKYDPNPDQKDHGQLSITMQIDPSSTATEQQATFASLIVKSAKITGNLDFKITSENIDPEVLVNLYNTVNKQDPKINLIFSPEDIELVKKNKAILGDKANEFLKKYAAPKPAAPAKKKSTTKPSR